MSNFNVWDKWGKLNSVMLGSTYSRDFYSEIKNKKIRDSFYRIADEAHEDLENFENVLKNFGCEVIRPDMDDNDSIMNYIDSDGALRTRKGVLLNGAIPRSPLQPRDSQITIGNTMYYTGFDTQGIYDSIERWNGGKSNIVQLYNNHDMPQFSAPLFTVVGKDLYVDEKEVIDPRIYKTLQDNSPGIRLNRLNIGGHNDGSFCVAKPGAILTVTDIQNYSRTFPDWDVHFVSRERGIDDFQKMKSKVAGKWWIPGEEDNDELIEFIETWLNDWTGYIEETFFDVNALVLDKNTICLASPDDKVRRFLDKHDMQVIDVPWRHRYFFDGGLHCITLDLHRDGEMTDYFPERTGPVRCEGFD